MLTVAEYQELLALNRALMEVRYLADNVDDATRGSAFLGNLHVRVIEEIKANLMASGKVGQVVEWERWQLLQTRTIELPRIIEYLSTLWYQLPSNKVKRDVLVNQLHPFKFGEDDIQRLVSELDGIVIKNLNKASE